MKRLLAIFYIVIVSMLLFNCKSNTEPEINYKNPDEMTWTCDTLYFSDVGQTMLQHLLAFSNTDIFAYGYSSSCKNIWKYNGNSWSLVDISTNIFGFNVNSLISFSNDSIWGFGESPDGKSEIIKYDIGLGWYKYNNAGQVNARLITACGDKQSNIYAAGDNGWIMYFDGSNWHRDQIKMSFPPGGFYVLRSSAVWKDTTYFTGYYTDNMTKDVYYFIKGRYNNWVVADSMVINNPSSEWKWGWYGMNVSNNNELLSVGTRGIWKYNGRSWDKIYNSPNNLVYDVFTLNSNYRIATCAFSKVLYYDGTRWVDLIKPSTFGENIEYTTAWGNGRELFIMGFTTSGFPQKTIIWHGK